MSILRSKKIILFVFGILIAGVIVVLFILQPRSNQTNQENISTDSVLEQDKYDLKDVNPEENYLILKRAGIPIENDSYAISYRIDPSIPQGVVIIIIDKASPKDAEAVRNSALAYLSQFGINQTSMKIEFRSLRTE